MEKKTDFKALDNKAKAGYLWDYYKWPFLIAVIIVVVLISLIHNFVTYQEPLLNVIMINCNTPSEADPSGFDEFLTDYGYDPKESPISLSSNLYFSETATSYQDYEVLGVMIAVGDQDLFFGSGDVFLDYAHEGALTDLSSILPEELLETYQDHLIYATDEEQGNSYPCAVELTDNEWLKKNNYYDTCYFGVFCLSQNPEASAQFAEFLLNYSSP